MANNKKGVSVMLAKVSGSVMEVNPEFDDKKNQLATVTVMLFQKGEKSLLAVKKVPNEIVQEGELVEGLPVRVNVWEFNGRSGMTCSYFSGDSKKRDDEDGASDELRKRNEELERRLRLLEASSVNSPVEESA